jgi:hypothetical protein
LLLVKTKDFTGWECSQCAWRKRREDCPYELGPTFTIDPIRQEFACHRCEDFDTLTAKLSRAGAYMSAWMSDIRTEERLASLTAAACMLWTVNLVTDHFAGVASIPALPQELTGTCAIATLIWIHAKWRRAVQNGLIQAPLRIGA